MSGPPAAASRRGLLVAAPALLVAACGGGSDGSGARARRAADVARLRELTAGERGLLAALPGDGPLPARLRRAGTDHVRALDAALRALGAAPAGTATPPPGATARPGDAFDARAAATAAARLQTRYTAVVPVLADPRVRRLAAGILAEHAAALAQLRLALGEPPVPRAFVT